MLSLGYLPVEYGQGRSVERCMLCTTSHAEDKVWCRCWGHPPCCSYLEWLCRDWGTFQKAVEQDISFIRIFLSWKSLPQNNPTESYQRSLTPSILKQRWCCSYLLPAALPQVICRASVTAETEQFTLGGWFSFSFSLSYPKPTMVFHCDHDQVNTYHSVCCHQSSFSVSHLKEVHEE